MGQSFLMIRKGLKVSLPIIIGYIPIALAFGVLSVQSGMSLVELTLMSMFVYAGASQFMGVNMIAASVGAMEIIIATFVLNFRHFVMSFSFMNDVGRHVSFRDRLFISAGLTDEAFAVISLNKEEAKQEKAALFYLTIIITGYLSWVIGSVLGGVLGGVIPERLSQSMGIALYAMFIGLLVPSVKRETRIGLIAVIAMVISALVSQVLTSGWAIVIGTVLGGFTGVFLLKEKEQ